MATITLNGILKLDQSAGITDDDVPLDVTVNGGAGNDVLIGSLDLDFLNYLNALPPSQLTDEQLAYAASAEGASDANFVTVTPGTGETISNLFFSQADGTGFTGQQVFLNDGVTAMTTIAGDSIYLWSSPDRKVVLATTSNVNITSGSLVAAFYIESNNAANTSAKVESVTFIPIDHPVEGSTAAAHDDTVDFSSILRVSATTALEFDFNVLKPSEYLWVGVGTSTAAVIASGLHLDVDESNSYKKTSVSEKIVASNGGSGTTIGLNNQLLDNAGETVVLTLVSGLTALSTKNNVGTDYLEDPNAANTKPDGMDYSGYINSTGAGIFLSQSQGNGTKNFDIEVFKAGGAGGTAEDGRNYLGSEPSGAFLDDTAVNVTTVTVLDSEGQTVGTWAVGAPGAGQVASGTPLASQSDKYGNTTVTVTIAGNHIEVDGVWGLYTVKWTTTELFNRFHVINELGQFDIGKVFVTEGGRVHENIGDFLQVDDDGPTLTAAVNGDEKVTHDETGGLQSAAATPGVTGDSDDDDVAGSALLSDGVTTIATLFGGIGNGVPAGPDDPPAGDDPDVAPASGPIGYARSGGSLLASLTGGFGTDGPAASLPLSYSISTPTNGATSGLQTTDNTNVLLYNGSGDTAGLILGRIGSATGAVAFAIGVDQATGEAFTVQYVSLKHPTPGTSYDESIQLSTGRVFMSVTRTDKDGDFVTDSDNDVSALIRFEDDGPTAPTVTPDTNINVTHDESPGLQNAGAPTATEDNNDNDVAGATIVDGTTIASRFLAGFGTAIGYARSGAGIDLVTISGGGFGADGQGSTSTTYGFGDPGGAASGAQTTGGTQIFIYKEGNLLVGRVGNENAGGDTANASGTVAFAIAINATTGEIYTAQYLSLKHSNTGSHDENSLATAAGGSQDGLNPAAVPVTVTYTDGDGDTATSPAANIGNQIRWEDDGPTVTAQLSGSVNLEHDETVGDDPDADDVLGSDFISGGSGPTIASLFDTEVPPADQGDDLDVLGSGPIGFARSGSSLLATPGGAFGSDGPGAVQISYALGTAAGGTFSGVQTTEGVDIFLYKDASTGLLLGRIGTEASSTPGSDAKNASGKVAFALAINSATGEMYVAQYLSLRHTNINSTDEATAALISTAVQVIVTRTDGDGDSAQTSVDVGDRIVFQDAGPDAAGTQTVNPLITDDSEITDTASVLATSLFNAPHFNEDGPGTTSFALKLKTENASSGATDTLTGSLIRFVTEAGTGDVVGYVDNDGDGVAEGTDNNGVIDAGETLQAFRYHLDPQGAGTADDEVIFTQYRSVVHPNVNDPNEAAAPKQLAGNTVVVERSITDGDLDPVKEEFDVGAITAIRDDGPFAFNPEDIVTGVKNQPSQSATKDLSGNGAVVNLTGVNLFTLQDGFGSVVFTGFANGDILQGTIQDGTPTLQNLQGKAPGDTSLSDIRLYGAGTGLLVAVAGTDPNVVGDRVFTIALTPGSDQYTFTMLGQISNGANNISLDFSGQKPTNYDWLTLDLPGNDPGDIGLGNNNKEDPGELDGDFLFTAIQRAALDGPITVLTGEGTANVKVSSTGIGVGSQSVNPLDGVFIDFIDHAPRTLGGNDIDVTPLDFTNHVTYNNAGFAVSQLKPNTGTSVDVRVSAYNEVTADPADSRTEIVNDAQLDIVSVTVRSGASSHTFTGDDTFTVAGRSIAVNFNPANAPVVGANDGLHDWFVDISNLGESYEVLIQTASGFERMLVENSGTDNEGFDIEKIIIEQFDAGNPISLSFDLRLTDGDGDFVDMVDLLGVTLAPPDVII